MGILRRLTNRLDPDRVLQGVVSSLIEAQAVRHGLDLDREQWEPGKPLKLLMAGYVGARNTGADVRVEEMIRQFRHIIGDDQLELTMMSNDLRLSAGYFRTARQVEVPQLFPKFLFDECRKHHAVVSCEGSMFKSKFASALTCMMAGALGMANAENKLSIGYGAEAGAMTPSLQNFVRRHCRDSLIICRNEPSRDVLGRLGIRTTSGADTAWTFNPAPLSEGAKILRDHGWDGKKKVLVLCPINPFWWPVKPDLAKTVARHFGGQYRDEHYKSIYFHEWTVQSQEKYDAYIDGIVEGVRAFTDRHDVFVVMVGMEQLDRHSCQDVSDKLPFHPPVIVSDEYDMYQLVSVLRNCAFMLSSRFHAIVTSMPGLVVSAGITMDERIRNLMNDRKTPELFLEVDDEDLGQRVDTVLERLVTDEERIRDAIGRTVPEQFALMGQMGIDFSDELLRVYPDFELPQRSRSWEAYLPTLSADLHRLMERYA